MKRLLIIIVVLAALATPVIITSSAHAEGSPHSCDIGGGGYVTASYSTSCSFATNIVHSWLEGDCWQHAFCSGHIHSPSTDETYIVSCFSYGHYPEHLDCVAKGTPAWIKFTYKYA
jgi:hypothetical protein